MPNIFGDPEYTKYVFIETDSLHKIPKSVQEKIGQFVLDLVDGQRAKILAQVTEVDRPDLLKAIESIETAAGIHGYSPNG